MVDDSTPWWLSEVLLGRPPGPRSRQRLVPHTPRVGPPSHPTALGFSARPTCVLPTGLFGTGIQSYFTFLRFLLLLNLLALLLTTSFVLLPLVWLRPPDPDPALNLSE